MQVRRSGGAWQRLHQQVGGSCSRSLFQTVVACSTAFAIIRGRPTFTAQSKGLWSQSMTKKSNAIMTESAGMAGILLRELTPKSAMLLGTFPMPRRSERGGPAGRAEVRSLRCAPPLPPLPRPPACPTRLPARLANRLSSRCFLNAGSMSLLPATYHQREGTPTMSRRARRHDRRRSRSRGAF